MHDYIKSVGLEMIMKDVDVQKRSHPLAYSSLKADFRKQLH